MRSKNAHADILAFGCASKRSDHATSEGDLKMSVDELLGRLEPTGPKFDIGRGGIPQLTPQDIAAALGMCEDKFARAMRV